MNRTVIITLSIIVIAALIGVYIYSQNTRYITKEEIVRYVDNDLELMKKYAIRKSSDTRPITIEDLKE